MAYTRTDRALNELRPMEAKVGVIKNARGSAMFKIGKTIAYAAVYGPREMHPKFMQNVERGTLRCNYNMMAFSGSGNRVRPGPSRRSREIGLVTQNALAPVIDLTEYPKTVVDVFIELLQTDAGTRCAGICAASLALADAGFKMKDLVCAVSCGVVGDTPVVDLDYSEEAYEGGAVDIPIAMIPRTGEVTLLQLDGVLTKEQLQKAVSLAKHGIDKIYEVQKAALRAKFTGGK
ncbi:MAG: exosome complex exonuclease Rrp41 [Candidatus Nanoarchaeia archaeon]|jgi:exosome complex component RRP41